MDISGNPRVLSEIPCELQSRLAEHGQEHVFRFWDELDDGAQCKFISQLETINLEQFTSLAGLSCHERKGKLAPAPVVQLEQSCKDSGEEAIRSGALGVLTVAGGQGTRLGWSGPKGTFPAAPITGKSLFQLVAEQIMFSQKKYKTTIPWYIMTSHENEEATISFLLDNNCFGIDRTDIFVFSQGEVPAVDSQGKMLLSSKGSIAMNPDGHGGVISALKISGGLEEMESRGVRYLSYIQIDNPLVHVVDPVFLGMHIGEHSSNEVSSKCVAKLDADERVGVFCLLQDTLTVVEYSDLPSDDATKVDDQDRLLFSAGSIAIHIISVDFINRVANELPWHRAHKKVPFILAETGKQIQPDEPNAFKFERFVFDILPMAQHSLVVETDRAEEFAPIKNATGSDSPESSSALQLERAARWLRMNGFEIPEHARVEISPLTASAPEDLAGIDLPRVIGDDEAMVV